MRYSEILNERILNEIKADLNSIERLFREDFWHCVEKHPDLEVYEHMDDPSIGRYFVHLANGAVTTIEYKHPLSAVFNRKFESVGSFYKHLSEITNDEPDDEALAAGAAKLRDIARKLRGEDG